MVRKGIHPLLKRMTVVFRNGASIRVPTVANKPAPYILQTDVTTSSVWTGEKSGLSLEDARIAKLMHQFKGFVPTTEAEEAEAGGSGGRQ